MENITLLMRLIVIYPLLIILFHLGKYPSPLVSPGNLKRECTEATIIFGVILIVRWLKTLYPSIFTWTIYNSTYLIAGLCLLFIMERIVRKRSLSTVGFKLPTNRKVLTIFTGLLAIYLVGGILSHLILRIELSYLNIYFISGCIIGPFVEESIFRGLIQTRLEAGLGAVKSWVISGLLFGFYHYWAHHLIAGKMLTIPSLTELIGITLFGMLLGVIFAKTRSLLPPFLLHGVNNFVAFG